jgi:hypothetical protein
MFHNLNRLDKETHLHRIYWELLKRAQEFLKMVLANYTPLSIYYPVLNTLK